MMRILSSMSLGEKRHNLSEEMNSTHNLFFLPWVLRMPAFVPTSWNFNSGGYAKINISSFL